MMYVKKRSLLKLEETFLVLLNVNSLYDEMIFNLHLHPHLAKKMRSSLRF